VLSLNAFINKHIPANSPQNPSISILHMEPQHAPNTLCETQVATDEISNILLPNDSGPKYPSKAVLFSQHNQAWGLKHVPIELEYLMKPEPNNSRHLQHCKAESLNHKQQ